MITNETVGKQSENSVLILISSCIQEILDFIQNYLQGRDKGCFESWCFETWDMAVWERLFLVSSDWKHTEPPTGALLMKEWMDFQSVAFLFTMENMPSKENTGVESVAPCLTLPPLYLHPPPCLHPAPTLPLPTTLPPPCCHPPACSYPHCSIFNHIPKPLWAILALKICHTRLLLKCRALEECWHPSRGFYFHVIRWLVEVSKVDAACYK